MLKKNQSVPLTIDNLSNDGNGVGRYDGMAVFVPFSAAGDVLQVKIVKVCKSHAFGLIEKVLSRGAGHIPQSDCEFFKKCGGCQFRHLTYQTELTAKEGFVADSMRRLGGITLPVLPILPSPDENRYRNKVQYPLTMENGKIKAGFYAGRSHRVISCADCLLQPSLLNEITLAICSLLDELHISAYDEESHRGLVRHIYLRHGIHTGEVLVCLVVNSSSLPHAKEFCQRLCSRFSCIKSIILNENTRSTNVILGPRCETLYGTGFIRDTLCDVPIRLDALSFYQVNTLGAEQLYRAAARLADLQEGDVLLDLYCGMGTIGLSMAKKAKQLIGVEIIPEAIENAKRSAKEMGLADKCRFFASDAGKAAATLAEEGLAPDVIILDPPRKGCDQITLDAVCTMSPQRIVMVSCNPATAARDTKILAEKGYTVRTIQPVDMFPRTKHVETVVLLSKGESV